MLFRLFRNIVYRFFSDFLTNVQTFELSTAILCYNGLLNVISNGVASYLMFPCLFSWL